MDVYYTVEYEIGESVYGRVCAVSHKVSGQKRILKSIRKRHLGKGLHQGAGGGAGGAGGEDVASWRRRELDKLRSGIRHPHINALLEWFETPDEYELLFEDAPGGEIVVHI